MKFILVIPARFESSRFPGKPLVQIAGKAMIHHVWDRCAGALPARDIYVATDDSRISGYCVEHGIQVLMTPRECLTGTDRVYRAGRQLDADIYINVQGDEPLISPRDIMTVMAAAQKQPDTVINAMCRISEEQDFRSPNVPKVVCRPDGRLLYMSRAPIPTDKGFRFSRAMKQVCIYAFPRSALEAFGSVAEKTSLECIEDIEVLRFLELGYEVRMTEVSGASIAVDVPEDVPRVEAALYDRDKTI